jgi:hypothetical protein
MTLLHSYYCPTCSDYGHDTYCLKCLGDTEREVVGAQVEYDDEADAKRLAEIRDMDEVAIAKRAREVKAYWDRMYAGLDYFAIAADITKAEPTYEIGFMQKRQAGGL